jgi:hypothetical protein
MGNIRGPTSTGRSWTRGMREVSCNNKSRLFYVHVPVIHGRLCTVSIPPDDAAERAAILIRSAKSRAQFSALRPYTLTAVSPAFPIFPNENAKISQDGARTFF